RHFNPGGVGDQSRRAKVVEVEVAISLTGSVRGQEPIVAVDVVPRRPAGDGVVLAEGAAAEVAQRPDIARAGTLRDLEGKEPLVVRGVDVAPILRSCHAA